MGTPTPVPTSAPATPSTKNNNPGPVAGGVAANNPNPASLIPPTYLDYKDCFNFSQDIGQTQIYYPSGHQLNFDQSITHSNPYSDPQDWPPDGMGQGFFGPSGQSFTVQECPLKEAAVNV